MKWEKLEKEHQKQWEEFNKLKNSAWQTLVNNRNATYEAFGNIEDKVPSSVVKDIERDRQAWQKDWAHDGIKAKELREIQKIEQEELRDDALLRIRNKLANSRDRNDDRER